MSLVFYVAFIVDHDIRERGRVVVEAGIDLLAGPYPSRALANAAVRDTCAAHPRLAAFAGLAAMVLGGDAAPPVRIAVIPVSDELVARYTSRHDLALPWPPPVVAPAVTARLDRTYKSRKSTHSLTHPA